MFNRFTVESFDGRERVAFGLEDAEAVGRAAYARTGCAAILRNDVGAIVGYIDNYGFGPIEPSYVQ